MKKDCLAKVEKAFYLKGRISAPPSKSYTIRAVIAAGLDARVKVINPLFSEDTLAAISALKKLGAVINKVGSFLQIKGFRGRPLLKNGRINVGESGTLLRLMLPIIGLGKGRFLIDGRGTLLDRPNKSIAEALLSLGLDLKGRGSDYRLPIAIDGKGHILGGTLKVSARMSSQAISSLLTVAGLAERDVTLMVDGNPVSRPYIDITLDVLKWAGIKIHRQRYKEFFIPAGQAFKPKKDFVVHGDYSSAAFLITACCLIKSDVVITDLVEDEQGDRKIIHILRRMGAKISHINNEVSIKGPFDLRGIDIDCSDTPDLVPILAVAGCFAKGKTRIYNIGHLAYKESNRIQTPADELRKLEARIMAGEDSLTIRESSLRPAEVSGCNDHRITMALAVCGLRIGGVTIKGPECICKSYPRFILDMKSLGAEIIV
jgi:3-phosphoshikimate 1-carboxyvinyltransferase